MSLAQGKNIRRLHLFRQQLHIVSPKSIDALTKTLCLYGGKIHFDDVRDVQQRVLDNELAPIY